MALFGSRSKTPAPAPAPAIGVEAISRVAPQPVAASVTAPVLLTSGIRQEDRARLSDVRRRLNERLAQNTDLIAQAEAGDITETRREVVSDALRQLLTGDAAYPLMKAAEREWVVNDLAAELVGYGPLEPLLANDDISEIMVVGPNTVYVEIAGQTIQSDISFASEESLQRICRKMVEQVGRRVDISSPMCDARLLDGSRINVVIPPVAVDGTLLTVRKFKKDKLTLEQLVKYGSLNAETMEVISVIGRCRLNVLVSGGTGSGKTTLLNCLTYCIDDAERIITCEDTAELQLQKPHVVRLETRAAGVEGGGEITMDALVKNALRMKPQRIIVGEVRDKAAVDLIQAMNTGHSGSMGTVHANDPRLALSRMEALIRTAKGYESVPAANIRRDLADSLDVIIQTEQLMSGKRVVTYVTEVLRMEGETITTDDLVVYDHAKGRHIGKGQIRPSFFEMARRYGMAERLTQALSALNARDQ